MLCCLGIIVGYYVGLSLGGIWPIFTGGAGFVVGLLFDRLWMRKMNSGHRHAMPCCGIGHQTHPSEQEVEHPNEQHPIEKHYLKETTVAQAQFQAKKPDYN